jgi:hypothetical protein
VTFPADLDDDLAPVAQFFVQQPDGLKHWAEIDRQAAFLKMMRFSAPRVEVWANANAGKRAVWVARKEGIRSGVFDLSIAWMNGLTAYIEFKGYDKSGRPGKLSQNQIEFGNRLTELGYPVACFFCPHAAIDWLREQGFPVRITT